MSPSTDYANVPDHRGDPTQRIDAAVHSETVITLATTADRQRLRNELLRLIIKSESQRKRQRLSAGAMENVTTEGSANSQQGSAEA